VIPVESGLQGTAELGGTEANTKSALSFIFVGNGARRWQASGRGRHCVFKYPDHAVGAVFSGKVQGDLSSESFEVTSAPLEKRVFTFSKFPALMASWRGSSIAAVPGSDIAMSPKKDDAF
jgi:hypothetical protein